MRLLKSALACAFLVNLGVAAASEHEERAWLGVSLSPVPKAMAKQLRLDGVGIMVVNVAEDSPAAEVGLEQYDVIVELNGERVSDEYDEFAERVQAIGVGGKAKLVVIRGGERTKAVVKLAEMPDADQIEYLFQYGQPEVTEWADDLMGRIIERGPGGRWTIRDLGELDDLGDVLEELKELKELKPFMGVPGIGKSFELRVETDDHGYREARVTRDGKTCEVRVDEDGKITVRHITEEGDLEHITEKTYESGEELKEADEEAYEIYRQLTTGEGKVIILRPDAPDAPRLKLKWRKEMQSALEKAKRQMKEAEKQMREAQEEAAEQLRKWRFFRVPGAWRGWPEPPEPPGPHLAHEPGTSFVVNEDGAIVVTTRKGDAELIREFKDTDDLKRRAPELYEKFKELDEAE